MEFSGKVAIITGASSGLGQATSIMFANKGAMITLCGRDQKRLQAVLELCTQVSGGYHDRFITVTGDLTDPEVRNNIVDKTIQKFGRFDILVANAGVLVPISTIQDATEEMFDHVFNVNVKSIFFLIQKAAPYLEKTKGNIISLSSVATSLPYPNSVYTMSKAAVDNMTRCLALDLGPKGIRVNAVNPSYIPTRIVRYFPGNTDDVLQKTLEIQNTKQPMGECGKPDDVAQAISFLASDAAKFITGECLLVDGGRALTGPRDSWSSQKASK